MPTHNTAAAPRPVRVAFLNCFDATLFAGDVQLNPADEARLGRLLAALQDYGILLLPRAAEAGDATSFDAVVAHLRASVGAPIVEAALAADHSAAAGGHDAPVAVMPVWPFQPEGADPADRDVLLSSGRLWGTDVLIEALRVADPDEPAPVAAVRPRFRRWMGAAGGGTARAVVRPPGEAGCYVLAAIAAPA